MDGVTYGAGFYGAGVYGVGSLGGDSTSADTSGGIVFGETDEFGVHWSIQRGSDPFGSSPAPRDVSGERATAHGTWNATEFYGPRTWEIRLLVTGEHDELHRARHRLASVCGLAPFPMVVDEPFYGPRWATFRRVGEALWTEDNPGAANASVSLQADDPLIRGVEVRTETALAPTTTGGLRLPFQLPNQIAANLTTGQMTLTNDGTEPASVLWRIDGPCDGISITNLDTAQQLRVLVRLGVGEFLTIDTATHRVLAMGDPQASRRTQVYGDWFDLAPGDTRVQFGASSSAPPASLSASWSDTWI